MSFRIADTFKRDELLQQWSASDHRQPPKSHFGARPSEPIEYV
jgi:hypothetical protein